MGGKNSKKCVEMKEECACWIQENQEGDRSSGFHLLEIHNNSTGLSFLYVLAVVGFAFLVYVIYLKCKGRYVFQQEYVTQTSQVPALRYSAHHDHRTIEPRIVEVRDEDERRSNRNRNQENWQNEV